MSLVFWALDRFSREGARATINYLHELESYGVGFVSYTERYLDSTGIFRDALIGLLAALANQEGIRLSDRVKAGMARARIEGKHVGRPCLDDRTRRQVRELRAQNPDMSIRAIARETEVRTLPPGDCSLSARSHQETERGLGLACVFVPLFLDPHIAQIRSNGRMSWQVATGYNQRSRVETQIGRWKSVIGPKLKSRSFSRQITEIQVGQKVLNTMTALGRPVFERIA